MSTQPDIILRGRFERDDERTFRHVPFEVPEGVLQLYIRVAHNDQIGSDPFLTDGNTLDIGLFDERGTTAGGPGFRGWSGSNKLEILIDNHFSTPPYRNGSPLPGTWHLLLGAYKVGQRGLDFEATIRLEVSLIDSTPPVIPTIESVKPPDLPAPAHPGWCRGDLHAHTVYSDGSARPAELAVFARKAGLDFFGITDHNRSQSPIDFVPQDDGWPVLVPGVEVTTYAGHFNVWGTDTWYEFRVPTAEGLQTAVDAARADGGLISLNHPKPFGPDWEYPEVTGFDCIEPWNGWWNRLNTNSLAEWDRRLREGQRLIGLGGSDVHHPEMSGTAEFPLSPARIGHPTTWIQTDEPLTANAIIAAIRAGRCFVSDAPDGPQLFVDLVDDELRVQVAHAANCALALIGPDGIMASIAIRKDDVTCTWPLWELPTVPYLRVEVHAVGGTIRALSQPVWLGMP